MTTIAEFQEEFPSRESYWRSIILFGRNVASYKFALSKSLLELADEGKTEVSLEELAVPYSRHLCEHVEKAPKQATSNSSTFISACDKYNKGEISYDRLISTTVSNGFNNVIDAFHNVNQSVLPIKFYEKDYSGSKKKIILTDEIHLLNEVAFPVDFMLETESRWNLVETAWSIGVNRNLLDVHYDDDKKLFFVNNEFKRQDVTSARAALNGYQKGKCFYCYSDITVSEGLDNSCDVDHFYPHSLQSHIPRYKAYFDGIWNLVLACPECNRGVGGKFAKVPAIKYLNRLNKRNEFLINSHHPLRETLMRQTGATAEKRQSFLREVDKFAVNNLIFRWDTEEKGEATF